MGVPLPGGTPPWVPPVRPDLLGGTPPQVPPSDLARGYPCQGEVPLPGGTPAEGYIPPPWVPLSDLARGVPHLMYPPCQTWPGGVHLLGWGSTQPRLTDGVLDMPRSVCLLCSRRRTFLFIVDLHRYLPKSRENPFNFSNIS